jgi:murein DD-endopeptidase MepM/ murein hydrolase activator NlpD
MRSLGAHWQAGAADRAAARAELAQRAAAQARAAAIARRDLAARAARAKREAMRPHWVKPIARYHLTAGFGESSGLWSRRHTGQDFAAPTGTPVRAVADGVIIFSGWDGPYGRKIVIRHADGTETWYAHLSAITASGKVGAGEIIGRVGSSGNTTGPHLHFEVRPGGGDPIEPIAWLRAHHIRV